MKPDNQIRKFLFIFLFFVIPWVSIGATAPVNCTLIGRPFFIPENYYVGDEVHCRIRIKVPEGVDVTVDPSVPLPDHPDLLIKEISVYPREEGIYDIDLFFILFYPQLQIPSLQIGDVILPEISVNTFSRLEAENVQFELLRKPIYLPYTRELIFLFFFIFLFFIVLFLLFSKKIRKKILCKLFTRRKIKPYTVVNQKILLLGNRLLVISLREFYTVFTVALRTYLANTINQNLQSITTGELSDELEKFFTDRRIVVSVKSLLTSADEIKFGCKRIDKSQQRHDLVVFKRVVSLIEKEMQIKREEIQKKKRRLLK